MKKSKQLKEDHEEVSIQIYERMCKDWDLMSKLAALGVIDHYLSGRFKLNSLGKRVFEIAERDVKDQLER